MVGREGLEPSRRKARILSPPCIPIPSPAHRVVLYNILKNILYIIGGTEQNRTAVRGFADPCLATRPRRPS